MNNKKIQLINPPLCSDYIESSRAGSYPPINLISLATYIKTHSSKYEVEILDGEILSLEEIESKIDARYVAIGTNILSYNNTIHIAQFAKNQNAVVVVGGHYASAIPELILMNRLYIDYIIIGDAEKALMELINESPLDSINNLVYRKNNNIIINEIKKISLKKTPLLDFEFVDLNKYFRNFNNNYPNKDYKRPLVIFSSKGCIWRSKSKGCIYCGIMHDGWRAKSASQIWNEILYYKNLYDIDFIWDVSDTITASKKWLKEFALSKPNDLNIGFHLYSRADQINSEVMDYLSMINCKELFIGAESGDDKCLTLSNKGYKAEQNIKAVEFVSTYNIKIVLSIMLGLYGESLDSISRTENMIKLLINISDIEEAFVNVLLPIPGCESYTMILKNNILKEKYYQCDLLPLEELRKDWLENFTNITYNESQFFRDRLLELFNIGSSFGKPKVKCI
ncbi:MAG: radical SAM protein [Ignavibacteriae bacterium]|nr:radical SAM protein [Ignavibacteriota bacterium]